MLIDLLGLNKHMNQFINRLTSNNTLESKLLFFTLTLTLLVTYGCGGGESGLGEINDISDLSEQREGGAGNDGINIDRIPQKIPLVSQSFGINDSTFIGPINPSFDPTDPKTPLTPTGDFMVCQGIAFLSIFPDTVTDPLPEVDVMANAQAEDAVIFGGDILCDALTATEVGDDLAVAVDGYGTLTLSNYFGGDVPSTVVVEGYGFPAEIFFEILLAEVNACDSIIGSFIPLAPPGYGAGGPVAGPIPDGSGVALIQALFDVEGPNPYINGTTMYFDALNSQFETDNGNGWRHEVKVAEENRLSMSDTEEAFAATVTPNLSDGSKTIIAQHHASDTGTLMKVYVSDTSEQGLIDSNPSDGVFDVYVRLANPGGGETVAPLGTITSGESFDLVVINDFGDVTVSALGVSASLQVADSTASYFKFGNYLQAQDPASGDDIDDSDDWADFYASQGITVSDITFSDIGYTRGGEGSAFSGPSALSDPIVQEPLDEVIDESELDPDLLSASSAESLGITSETIEAAFASLSCPVGVEDILNGAAAGVSPGTTVTMPEEEDDDDEGGGGGGTGEIGPGESPEVTPSEITPGSPVDLIQLLFDVEGNDPYVNDTTMQFDALASQTTTPNGNGWRNEVKIAEENRVAMSETNETFNADITAVLSPGSKTIISQHHASDTGTLTKVYMADTSEGDLINSTANDGIFDVYVRLANPGGGETKVPLGTVTSGETFNLSIVNEAGTVSVAALGTATSLGVADSTASYFKFGNYLQAQDPVTGEDIDSSDDWAAFYEEQGITESVITFENLIYTREVL